MNAALRQSVDSIRQTYVEPWRDAARARHLMAACVGCLGAGLQVMYMNFSIAGLGIEAAALYHFIRLLLLGTVTVPLSFWFLSQKGGRYWVAFMQLAGMGLLAGAKGHPVLCAFGFAMTSGGYWGLFSQRYAAQLSRSNHGGETALLLYIMILLSSLGTYFAGPMLEAGMHKEAMVLGSLGMAVGSFIMGHKRVPYHKEWAHLRSMVHWRRPTVLLSFFYGFQGLALDFGIASWMVMAGVTPLSAGLALALRPVLGMVLSPVVGILLQRGRVNMSYVGGAGLVAGWLLLLPAAEHNGLLLPALTVMTIGMNFVGPAEVSRWYKRRSVAAIMTREFLLTCGRLPAIPMMVLIIFLAPVYYPLFGLATGLLFTAGVRRYSRRIKASRYLGWRR